MLKKNCINVSVIVWQPVYATLKQYVSRPIHINIFFLPPVNFSDFHETIKDLRNGNCLACDGIYIYIYCGKILVD